MLNLKLLVGKPAQNVPGSIGSEGFARSKLTEGYLTFSRAKPVTSQVLIIYIYTATVINCFLQPATGESACGLAGDLSFHEHRMQGSWLAGSQQPDEWERCQQRDCRNTRARLGLINCMLFAGRLTCYDTGCRSGRGHWNQGFHTCAKWN